VLVQSDPAGHVVHEVDFCNEYVPLAHVDIIPLLQIEPAGQIKQ
jgi:hypothetical protein